MHAVATRRNGPLLDRAGFFVRGIQRRERWMKRHYLLASDFDQTLSFNDSGILLSEMLGISGFAEKCAGLSAMHLVQQGAELAYLLLHDPEYRRVRSEDLAEVGRRIRLKQGIPALSRILDGLQGYRFT